MSHVAEAYPVNSSSFGRRIFFYLFSLSVSLRIWKNDLTKTDKVNNKIIPVKKVLYIFRHDELSDYFTSTGSFSGPADFLWGLGSLDAEKIDRYYVNAPRLEKRKGIRKFTNIIERPFSKYTKIGFL